MDDAAGGSVELGKPGLGLVRAGQGLLPETVQILNHQAPVGVREAGIASGCPVAPQPAADGAGAGRKQPAGLPLGQAARFQLAHQLPPKTLTVTAGHGRPERVGTI